MSARNQVSSKVVVMSARNQVSSKVVVMSARSQVSSKVDVMSVTALDLILYLRVPARSAVPAQDIMKSRTFFEVAHFDISAFLTFWHFDILAF